MPVRQPHYQIRLNMLPSGQYAEVKVRLRLPDRAEQKRMAFHLHKQFGIAHLSAKGLAGYAFNRAPAYSPTDSPEAGLLEVFFEEGQADGEVVELEFDYTGWITAWPADSPNRITREWVELGGGLSWFPRPYRAQSFTFELEVTCEAGYQVVGMGETEEEDSVWHFKVSEPVDDIVVAAGPAVRSLESSTHGRTTRLHFTHLHPERAGELLDELRWMLDRMEGWFGPLNLPELVVIQPDRQNGSSYTRRGLIVLGGLEEESCTARGEGCLHSLGRSAARLWWSQADPYTRDSWLNHTFAEYSALLLVREKYGQSAFEDRLEEKEAAGAGAPPVWDAGSREEYEAEQVEQAVFQKGPLLLNALSLRIGETRFLTLLRAVLAGQIRTTPAFLELLDEQAGEETRFWMEKKLKEGLAGLD